MDGITHNQCTIFISTQVLMEGTDIDVYEVGKILSDHSDIIQTYDMTLEAVVTKVMWMLGFCKTVEQIKQQFMLPVNKDICMPGVIAKGAYENENHSFF